MKIASKRGSDLVVAGEVRREVRGARDEVKGSRCKVQGAWGEVRGTRDEGRGERLQVHVLGARCQIQRTTRG